MKTRLPSPAIAVALFLTACGSSSDPATAVTFTHATVDLLGTLTVNGTAYQTGGAVVRYLDDGRVLHLRDDAPSGLPFLPGTVVAVRGRIAADGRTGIAEEVLVRSVLRGPLQGRGESSLAVAGADVLLDARTVLLGADGAPAAIDAIPGGARLEVHGWPESGTRVRATLVRVLPGEPAVSVHGWTLAAPSGGVFDLSLLSGGAPLLRVDAAAASGAASPPAAALVRVGGSGITAGGPPLLAATDVAVIAQLLPIGEERGVIEGLVLGGTLAELQVGEFRVRTTDATRYEGLPSGGTPEAIIGPGIRLVAEGALQRGTLVAERLRFVDVLRLEGRIDPGSLAIANPASGASFTLAGAVVVVGAGTRLTSGGSDITLSQLIELHAAEPAGLPISVIGYRRADEAVQAHRLAVTGG